jgi:hypothetical protein
MTTAGSCQKATHCKSKGHQGQNMAVKAAKISVCLGRHTDRKGTRITGELSGHNPALIKAQLRKQGITPGKVRKETPSLLNLGNHIKAGHCPVHPANGNHDESRGAAAAVVRHHRRRLR